MTSIKCPQCGLVNWAEAGACKRCGAIFAGFEAQGQAAPGHWSGSPNEEPYSQGYNQQGYEQQGYGQHAYNHQGYRNMPYSYTCAPAGPKNTGLAIASMVLGILGMVTFGLFGILGLLGLILGVIALGKAKSHPATYGGQGFAIAGIVTSCLSMVATVGVIFAIAIPNLLASRKAANEGAAISSLRALNAAEATYQSTTGEGSYGTMDELYRASLVEPALASGTKSGYRFVVRTAPHAAGNPASFEIVATPVERGGASATGTRSFFVDESGVIRVNKSGLEASIEDPPLGELNGPAENIYRNARRMDYRY